MKVISALRMEKSQLDEWLKPTPTATNFGTIGKTTSGHSKLTLSYLQRPLQPKCDWPLVLLSASGQDTTETAIELRVAECRQRYVPSRRPANWTMGKAPYTSTNMNISDL